ncbi:GNAT family N-acetyltransferase [Clostridium sp. UBA6640]|uniref:GNAT family N-acetyltransferase n=1 Tax=Clostridium sp. UBA6640 TaxID=1946370 RepID=UPI0025C1D8B8|nr:GNAT family N-acetyltransferase [Clostridium sp. UBA6640]
MSSIDIRNAEIKDVKKIASLLYITETNPEVIWGTGSKGEIIERLAYIVKESRNRFSYQHAKVAVVNNEIAGILFAIPHGTMKSIEKKTAKLLMKGQKGFKEKVGYIPSIIMLDHLKESEPGELFIANIATHVKYQGRGIGRALMMEAEKMAKEKGLNKISLLVDVNDHKVIHFYTVLGYKVVEESHLGKKIYIRMIKEVQ